MTLGQPHAFDEAFPKVFLKSIELIRTFSSLSVFRAGVFGEQSEAEARAKESFAFQVKLNSLNALEGRGRN